MNRKFPVLGVLGGLGPMSTFRFCSLLTEHTQASADADHIDMIVSSRATTPDRTAFILGKSKEDPLPVMLCEAERLEKAGASLIVIPCNTAHYFYCGLQKRLRVPMINIIEETVLHLKRLGVRRVGLLATEGTVFSGAYHTKCREHGLELIVPDAMEQNMISDLIYESIKQNKTPDLASFQRIVSSLQEKGCERIVLGCTELSLLERPEASDRLFVDSLEVLAWRTILACGKTPVGFSEEFCATDGTEALI